MPHSSDHITLRAREQISKLLPERRRQRIAQLLDERGSVTSEELAASFSVSYMTILRDLRVLEEEGKLRSVHGGAVKIENVALAEPFFATKRSVNQEKKEVIASFAAQHFVKDNDVIIVPGKVLGAGTLAHSLTVAAYQFSESSRKAIETAKGKCLSITDIVKNNPKGLKVRIIG